MHEIYQVIVYLFLEGIEINATPPKKKKKTSKKERYHNTAKVENLPWKIMELDCYLTTGWSKEIVGNKGINLVSLKGSCNVTVDWYKNDRALFHL